MKQQDEQVAVFLLGTAIGTIIGLILTLLFAPQSGEDTRQLIKDRSYALKDKAIADKDHFTQRIQSATDEWITQLRAVTDDLVAQGRISADDAHAQINGLVDKMRS